MTELQVTSHVGRDLLQAAQHFKRCYAPRGPVAAADFAKKYGKAKHAFSIVVRGRNARVVQIKQKLLFVTLQVTGQAAHRILFIRCVRLDPPVPAIGHRNGRYPASPRDPSFRSNRVPTPRPQSPTATSSVPCTRSCNPTILMKS